RHRESDAAKGRECGATNDMDVVVRTGIFDARSMDPIGSVDLHTKTDNSHSSAALIPSGPCVHNGHIPAGASCGHYGNSPALPMSPYRLSLCLIVLGWSERELARRTGEHRTTIQTRFPFGKSISSNPLMSRMASGLRRSLPPSLLQE